MITSTPPPRCLVCGSGEARLRYRPTFSGTPEEAERYFLTDRARAVHGQIVECVACRFVYTYPRFEPDDYNRIYASVAAQPSGRSRETSTTARYRALAERVRRERLGGRLLDFGCREGGFLQQVPEFDGWGFDISNATAVDEAHRTVRAPIDRLDDVGYPLMHGSFDVVTAWDVLEHVADLDACLAQVRSLLVADGLLMCTVPDIGSLAAKVSGRWWNCLLLEHLWYFDRRSLGAYLTRSGFRVLSIDSIGFQADVATLVQRIGQTFGVPVPAVPSRVSNIVVSVPVGLLIAVAARTEA